MKIEFASSRKFIGFTLTAKFSSLISMTIYRASNISLSVIAVSAVIAACVGWYVYNKSSKTKEKKRVIFVLGGKIKLDCVPMMLIAIFKVLDRARERSAKRYLRNITTNILARAIY